MDVQLQPPGKYLAQAVWDTSRSCYKGDCTTIEYTVDPQYTRYLTLDGKTKPIDGGKVLVGAQPILLENQ